MVFCKSLKNALFSQSALHSFLISDGKCFQGIRSRYCSTFANKIRNSNASDTMENRYLAHSNSPADSSDINFSASSYNNNYCQPLPTIPEWQGRKYFSPSTANPCRPKVSESNVRVSKINEASKRHFESVYMAKFPASSHNQANVSDISDVLQSSQITNAKQSLGNSKVIRSQLQTKSMSRKGGKLTISDER